MANVMIRIDDDFKKELSKQAKELGLSLSSYIKTTMKEKSRNLKNRLVIDELIKSTDGDTVCTYEEFKNELDEMIANATN